MRILFSGTPGYGHLLPLLPLARAFRRQGDNVAFATGTSFADLFAAEDMELLPVGPALEEQLSELVRRTGADPAAEVSNQVQAEFFAGVRIDLVADEALAAARDWQPDLIVSEHYDFVGPFVAAMLGVPAATVVISPPLGSAFDAAAAKVADSRYRERGITASDPRWYFDTIPPALQPGASDGRRQRIGLRPEAHRASGWRPTTVPQAPKARPVVLVSFGTQFSIPAVIGPILRVLAAQDFDIRTTLGPSAAADEFGVDSDNVTFVGFTPFAELLQEADLVVTHGGAGTTLGALARSTPLVLVPLGADQFVLAEKAEAAGTGIALPQGAGDPDAVAKAVATVLADPRFRAAAEKVAGQIAGLASPEETAAMLREAVRPA